MSITVRPFRNKDPLALLKIWQKNQYGPGCSHFFPMAMDQLDTGPLAVPFFDRCGIQVAFADGQPVGFAQVSFGPNTDCSDFSRDVGHIVMVVVDPEFPKPVTVCRELIRGCENVLITSGAREIFGGSPRPCLPFYLSLYGMAEPISFFDTDVAVGEAFRKLGYVAHQKTIQYQRDLTDYEPPFTQTMLQWIPKLQIIVNDWPTPNNWWDALSLVRFDWIETRAILGETNQPIAQIRIRMNEPVAGPFRWDGALMDIRVHPGFRRQGVGTYVLAETLRYIIEEGRLARIEAHFTEDCTSLRRLLTALDWSEVETGTIFKKIVRQPPKESRPKTRT